MKRKFLFNCYQSLRGKRLQAFEVDYLRHAITVGCQQTILQIGALGWENQFIDCSLYQKFFLLDRYAEGDEQITKIQARAFNLPLQTNSIDLVILPHLLEFDAKRFQTMREIERILKPEGDLIILNFNPWSLWLRHQYFKDKQSANSWHGHFISRSRLLDWLKLLNFDIKNTAEFNNEGYQLSLTAFEWNKNTLLANAYAIKAVKRRYTLIPLTEVLYEKPTLLTVGGLESSQRITNE